jgi:hypothetical protein
MKCSQAFNKLRILSCESQTRESRGFALFLFYEVPKYVASYPKARLPRSAYVE